MSTKAEYRSGIATFYNSDNFESVQPMAPVLFYDDFIGTAGVKTATNGAIWTLVDTGDATEADVANEPSGAVALTLAASDEAEVAAMTFGDKLDFVPGQGLVFECRVKLSVRPTGNAQIVWGLASAYNATPDTVAQNAWFRADAGGTAGLVYCESDDASTNTDDVTSGITVLTTTWHVYRIDASNKDNVLFYIDGAQVASGTTFKLVGAAGPVQPCFQACKASGTGVGTLQIDYVRVWQKRS